MNKFSLNLILVILIVIQIVVCHKKSSPSKTKPNGKHSKKQQLAEDIE
jgi:hypothetical protein